MRGYPTFSFWISIKLVQIYISCIIINRDKNTFELVGTVLNANQVKCWFLRREKNHSEQSRANQITAFFIILRNSSSSTNGHTAFWLPSIKDPTPTTDDVINMLHASVSKRVLVHNHSNGNELRILMQIKLISVSIVEHQDSLPNRDNEMAH